MQLMKSFRRRLSAFLTIAALATLVIAGPALSQSAPSTPATVDQKVDELVKMLDDPDIRALLAAKQPAPAAPANVSFTQRLHVWENVVRQHFTAIFAAVPKIPSELANAVHLVRMEFGGRGFFGAALLVAAFLATGFGSEWLFRRLRPEIVDTDVAGPELTSLGYTLKMLRRLLSKLAPIAIFFLFSAGFFLVFPWPPLLRLIVLTSLLAFVLGRLALAIGNIILAPENAHLPEGREKPLRLLPMGDADARFWYRSWRVFVCYFLVCWALLSILPDLRVSPFVSLIFSYIAGIGLLALGIWTVWQRPAVEGENPMRSRMRRWLVSNYLILLWLVWAAGLEGIFWLGLYAIILPGILAIADRIAQTLARPRAEVAAQSPVIPVLIISGIRAAILALAVGWLVVVWQFNATEIATGDTVASRIIRGLFNGAIILLVADLLWRVAKAYIDWRLELSAVDASTGHEPADISPAEAARRGRMRTLLPIFRNMLAVLLATVAGLMVLSGLGVAIGPLIAGAGIFGVAIGFGSQTLVKDVLSGVFYMLDDAFRIGEYIQSGSYMGTVESFSLRSVRLRHHRGPVFTIPFGSLGAVQNMSRDWAIAKFTLRVPFDTDLAKAKKLVKQVGVAMLADPDIAPNLIETIKMKGVETIGEYGIELSFAFMARPGQQASIRRRAYAMIRDTFGANGIDFARPTVKVGNDGKSESSDAAIAAASSDIARRAADAAAQAKE